MEILALVYYSIIIINAIAFVSGRKYKSIYLPSALFLILFVMGKRYDGSMIGYDYTNYQHDYENFEGFQAEIGYKFLSTIFYTSGFAFEYFYMFIVAAILCLIFYSTLKMKSNMHLVIVAYMIYFVLITMDLLRNQCALALLLSIALPFYKSKKLLLKKTALAIIAAATFHISYVLHAIPFLLGLKIEKSKIKKVFIYSLIIFFALFVTSSGGIIKNILESIVPSGYMEDRYAKYIGSNLTSLSSLASVSIYFLTIWGLFYWKKKCVLKWQIINNDLKMNAELVIRIVFLAAIFIPLLLVNAVCYRYVRDITFLAIIFWGINSGIKETTYSTRLAILANTVAISVGWFIFDIVIKGYFPDYVMHFFVNEIISI